MPIINTRSYTAPPLTPLMKLLGKSAEDTGGYASAMKNDSFFVAGISDISALLAKYNLAGDLQWQRRLGEDALQDLVQGVGIDNSGNSYITGRSLNEGLGSNEIFLAKYNSSGTLQWQRMIGTTTSDQGMDLATDDSGNSYIIAKVLDGPNVFCLIKYNTSGVLQWQRFLGTGSARHNYAEAITLDNNGDIIVTGYTTNLNHPYNSMPLVKYNSSGVLQWQLYVGAGPTEGNIGHGLTADSSNNIYLTGRTTDLGEGAYDALITKFNSSGVIQWQKILGKSSGSDWGIDISVDSSGNVYAVGRYDSGSGTRGFVVKYNSSGTLQWQRTVGGATTILYGINVHDNGNMYITGYTSAAGVGTSDLIMFRLPTDGTGTGTFSYSASTLVAGTPTMITTTGTLVDEAGTLTDQAGILTGNTPTLVETTL